MTWTRHADSLSWSDGHVGAGYLLYDGTVKTWNVDPYHPYDHADVHQRDGDFSPIALNFDIDPDGGVVTDAPTKKVEAIIAADARLYDAGQRPQFEDDFDLEQFQPHEKPKGKTDYNFVMSMALRPEDAQAYMDQYGPYLEHWTKPENVPGILRRGIEPASHASSEDTEWEDAEPFDPAQGHLRRNWDGFIETRPGYTYLARPGLISPGADKNHLGEKPYQVPVRVDLRNLDHRNLEADEDAARDLWPQWKKKLIERYGLDPNDPESEWQLDWLHDPPDPRMWDGANSTYNLPMWADDIGVDDPEWTRDALLTPGQGALAHHGTIPPEAISLHPDYMDKYPPEAGGLAGGQMSLFSRTAATSYAPHYNRWTGLLCNCAWGRRKSLRRDSHRTAGLELRKLLKAPDKAWKQPEGQAFLKMLEDIPEDYDSLLPFLAQRFKKDDVRIGPPQEVLRYDRGTRQRVIDHIDPPQLEYLQTRTNPFNEESQWRPVRPNLRQWHQWYEARQHPLRRGVNVMDPSFTPSQIQALGIQHHQALAEARQRKNWLTTYAPYADVVHRFGPEAGKFKGWQVVGLDGAQAEGDSEALGHCIGSDEQRYKYNIEMGNINAYSLRDREGYPHVSWHINPSGADIGHMQGQSGYPNDDYRRLITMFNEAKGLPDEEGYEESLEPPYDELFTFPSAVDMDDYIRFNDSESYYEYASEHGNIGDDTAFEWESPDWARIARDYLRSGGPDEGFFETLGHKGDEDDMAAALQASFDPEDKDERAAIENWNEHFYRNEIELPQVVANPTAVDDYIEAHNDSQQIQPEDWNKLAKDYLSYSDYYAKPQWGRKGPSFYKTFHQFMDENGHTDEMRDAIYNNIDWEDPEHQDAAVQWNHYNPPGEGVYQPQPEPNPGQQQWDWAQPGWPVGASTSSDTGGAMPSAVHTSQEWEGWTNWATASVGDAIIQDQRLSAYARVLVQRQPVTALRDWAIRRVIAPLNQEVMQDAQSWNAMPEAERIDPRYEQFQENHGDNPQAMDIWHGLLGGPDTGDFNPTNHLIDPELVNWQEIYEELGGSPQTLTPFSHTGSWEDVPQPMAPIQTTPTASPTPPRSNPEAIYQMIGEAMQRGDQEMALWLYQYLPEQWLPQPLRTASPAPALSPATELMEWLADLGGSEPPPSIHHDSEQDMIQSPSVSAPDDLAYYPPDHVPKEVKQSAERPVIREWSYLEGDKPHGSFMPRRPLFYDHQTNHVHSGPWGMDHGQLARAIPRGVIDNHEPAHEVSGGWLGYDPQVRGYDERDRSTTYGGWYGQSGTEIPQSVHEAIEAQYPSSGYQTGSRQSAIKTADSPINQADATVDALGKAPAMIPSREGDPDYLQVAMCPHCYQAHRPDQPCPDSAVNQWKAEERAWYNRDNNAQHPGEPDGHSQIDLSKVGAETAAKRLKRAQELEARLGVDQAQVVHQFPDGWTVRQLKTYGDAYREGQLMANCFAHDTTQSPHSVWSQHPQARRSPNFLHDNGYDFSGLTDYSPDLPDETYGAMFSLRDAHNLPHVSLDFAQTVPALGRHNQPPHINYKPYLKEWGLQSDFTEPYEWASAFDNPMGSDQQWEGEVKPWQREPQMELDPQTEQKLRDALGPDTTHQAAAAEYPRPQDRPSRSGSDRPQAPSPSSLSRPISSSSADSIQAAAAQAWAPEDWKNFDTSELYHSAPTTERARILQHGLQASAPYLNERWPTDQLRDQKPGVYLSIRPEDTDNQQGHDIWKVNPELSGDIEPEYDWFTPAWRATHSIPPEALTLHRPWEDAQPWERQSSIHPRPDDPQGDWETDGGRTAAHGDGDGYVTCNQGHDHWGRYGAAGALLRHVDDQGQERYLMTLRSPQVHEGGVWGIPGGAIDSHEQPHEAALREAQEELGQFPEVSDLRTVHSNDHGGWAYHTVTGNVAQPFQPQLGGWETSDAGWYTPEQIDQMDLHPGFAQTWQQLRGQRMGKSSSTSPDITAMQQAITKLADAVTQMQKPSGVQPEGKRPRKLVIKRDEAGRMASIEEV